MADYKRRAIRGAGIVFVFSLLTAFLNYLVRVVLAKNLSVSQ